jgi:hypothetical protein
MKRLKKFFVKHDILEVVSPFSKVYKTFGLGSFFRNRTLWSRIIEWFLFAINLSVAVGATVAFANFDRSVSYSTVLSLGLNFIENVPFAFIETNCVLCFMQRENLQKILMNLHSIDIEVSKA